MTILDHLFALLAAVGHREYALAFLEAVMDIALLVAMCAKALRRLIPGTGRHRRQ
ncbi:hypothetical protein ACFXKC_45635 [Streptomyces sp. NPDC059340]|uniref:hypothetical protein n=1 Tax=Streptomyces sp. NPDC059340 TaxID=3346806 RepID=UPI0036792DF4